MNRLMRRAALALVMGLGAGAPAPAAEEKWIPLFDGKTLSGWSVVELPGQKSRWDVQDGALCGSGGASMIVTDRGRLRNFRLRAEIKINDKGNSGMYFRTTPKPGFADGYEAQIDSTHADPIRTGSLYGMCHVYTQLVKPDTWFTYEIEVQDGEWHGRPVTFMTVRVDGKELYRHLDFVRQFKEGHVAFQQHDPGSKVCIRKVEVMPLP